MMNLEFFIPFYGEPEYLLQSIERIRMLEDTQWRLTIVEDAYPDGETVEHKVCTLGDHRIRYLRNEKNLGVNGNIYRCIQLAEWDYFVVTDFDDLVLPNYGKAVEAMLDQHPDAAMLQPRIEVIDEEGRAHFPLPDRVKSLIGPSRCREVALRGQEAARSLMRGNWLYTPALCMRRHAAQKAPFRPGMDAVSDLGFVVDVLLEGESLVMGTEVAFQYRRHRASHSSSNARNGDRFVQEREYFGDIRDKFDEVGWATASRAARIRATSRLNALTQLPGALKSKNRPAAHTLIRHVFGA